MVSIQSRSVRLRAATLLMMLVASSWSWTANVSAAPALFFAETQHSLADPMLSYWKAHGGLPVFGFPVSEAFGERSVDTGTTYPTQYFERNRFESHPENTAPYHVLLGRLGDEVLKHQGRDWQSFPKAATTAAHRFEQTGHALAHRPFWRYWSSHGLEFDGKRGVSYAESLALWGLPLSEPQMETNSSGDRVLTQWFERARFEDHGTKGVLLGLLGNEITAHRRVEVPFQPVGAAQPPQPTPDADELHRASQHLWDLTNERRQAVAGKAPYGHRDDLQAVADQIAREWTEARRNGGDSRGVIERYNEQLAAMSPSAGVIYALEDAPLEAGCQGIDPRDPIAKAVSPYVVGYDAHTLTVGVHGPYAGVCGRAMSVVYLVGY
jgi:hypothetical protein